MMGMILDWLSDRTTTSTGAGSAPGLGSRFWHDERGAITTDIALILLPILLIILTIFEIGITFYFLLAAQKAAQMGARFIVVEDPLHSQVPLNNDINYAAGREGDSCFNLTASANPDGTPSPCTQPSFQSPAPLDVNGDPFDGWQCNGAGLVGECDATAFGLLVSEMQIVYPKLTQELVTVNYTYERLGYAGGPFQPRVEVVIAARESPIKILSFMDLIWTTGQPQSGLGAQADGGTLESARISGTESEENWEGGRLRRVSASVFGADLNSANDVN